MKKTNITLALLFLLISPIFSQNFAGKRIYSGSLGLMLRSQNGNSAMASSSYGSKDVGFNATFLTGKIRANNTYTAYGFSLAIGNSQSSGTSSNTNKNNSFNLGPTIQYGKFVKVFEQFYYAPTLTCSVLGGFGSNKVINYQSPFAESESSSWAIGANANATPIRFVYQLNEKVMLNMSLGNAGINYNYFSAKASQSDYVNDGHNFSIQGDISNFTGIGAFYLF